MARIPRGFRFDLPLFADGSAWRQRADQARVISANPQYLAATQDMLQRRNRNYIELNFDVYAFPIFGIQSPRVTSDLEILPYPPFDPNELSPPLNLPWYSPPGQTRRIRARCVPQPNGFICPSQGADQNLPDGAMLLYEPCTGEEYDFWQVTTDQGQAMQGTQIMSAGHIAWFPTRGQEAYGSQMPPCKSRAASSLPRDSCRVTGVPYLAGLLLPEDFEGDLIDHALAFTLPMLRYFPDRAIVCPPNHYYYPATSTEHGGDNSITERFALAAGMRIRLKGKGQLVNSDGKEVNEAALAPGTRMFLCALRTYGAYLVDAGGAFGFACEDICTAPDLPDGRLQSLLGNAEQLGNSQWEILMNTLRAELHNIPFCFSPEKSNFDVIENATPPSVNWLRG